MTKFRPLLWVLLVVCATTDIVLSTAGVNPLVGSAFGLLTLAFGAALVADHRRNRRANG